MKRLKRLISAMAIALATLLVIGFFLPSEQPSGKP
jgi:hypothetical protein